MVEAPTGLDTAESFSQATPGISEIRNIARSITFTGANQLEINVNTRKATILANEYRELASKLPNNETILNRPQEIISDIGLNNDLFTKLVNGYHASASVINPYSQDASNLAGLATMAEILLYHGKLSEEQTAQIATAQSAVLCRLELYAMQVRQLDVNEHGRVTPVFTKK